jgi:hypothetical protein
MDPPYMVSDNYYYEKQNKQYENVYEFFALNNNVKFEARIYFILAMNWIVKLLFRNHKIIYEYSKIYQITKKETIHGFLEW